MDGHAVAYYPLLLDIPELPVTVNINVYLWAIKKLLLSVSQDSDMFKICW